MISKQTKNKLLSVALVAAFASVGVEVKAENPAKGLANFLKEVVDAAKKKDEDKLQDLVCRKGNFWKGTYGLCRSFEGIACKAPSPEPLKIFCSAICDNYQKGKFWKSTCGKELKKHGYDDLTEVKAEVIHSIEKATVSGVPIGSMLLQASKLACNIGGSFVSKNELLDEFCGALEANI